MIPPDQSDNQAAGEFFITLLHASTSAHLLHLQTRSFSEHSALDGLYSGLADLTDSLIEAFQGKYGLVANYPSGYSAPVGAALEFVSRLGDYVEANRASLGDDSELQNIIDEIMQLIDSTIYKMRFLA